MIADNLRDAIRTLHGDGNGKKSIARYLKINIKTIRAILASETNEPKERSDKKNLDEQLLRDLYARCGGYIQRMHEILQEEHAIQIGYSTLTRLVNESGLAKPNVSRCYDYPDIPGDEMQQDTSSYIVTVGGKKMRVIASGLYFRYSKMRYVKFYHSYDRFAMKCFFFEALIYFGYSAKTCIIDNTNLAVASGTGERAPLPLK